MDLPPEDHNSELKTLIGLGVAILLVGLAFWVLMAFRQSSSTMDCVAAGHHDCAPAQ